jgi:hypothetical protein
MRALAMFRIGLGTFAWVAPRAMNRIFGVPRDDDSAALDYMNRVFGVRAVSLGAGYLASSGPSRDLWHRLWLHVRDYAAHAPQIIAHLWNRPRRTAA